jgi:citrate synthase
VSASRGWIGAEAALAELGVRPQTLYAYVSRNRVEARPDPSDPRRSLYSRADVESLAQRRRAGRKREAIAASAISWGEPLLRSAISTVHAGRLVYRGVDAIDFSRAATLEEAAILLWEADRDIFSAAQEPGGRDLGSRGDLGSREAAFAMLADLAANAEPAFGRAGRKLCLDGATVLRGLVRGFSGAPALSGEPVHRQLARGWRACEAEDPLRCAVLLADHELNASAFAARVTASTGAAVAASALSGLAALTGPLHGSAPIAVAGLASEARQGNLAVTLRACLRTGQSVPGFGHPLYPGADPRAVALLETFEIPADYAALRLAAEDVLGLSPNVDFALAALAARFVLPDDAPFSVFALARCVGWIAHAIEQSREGRLIRPRARYVGRMPPQAGAPRPRR